ncbi:MAG TPA: FAD:protein FMN transferase [Tepidimicrobium sp.]|nr:FAD:protein FMN transferase [Tepidimicrobium sp.]
MRLRGPLVSATLSATLIITMLFAAVGCQEIYEIDEEPLTRTEFLMDTVIKLNIYDRKDEGIMDKAVDRLKEIEEGMSATIPTSDVNLINENAGIKPVKVREDVYQVIQEAKNFAIATDGAYDPTIGPLVELWDIASKNREEADSIPTDEEIQKAKDLVDYNDLELRDGGYVYLKRPGMKIDLGGIAKGYAADEVKDIFVEEGVKSAIIDLGGDIYALGNKGKGRPWRIGIEDPFEKAGSYLGVSNVENKSIVTSGDYKRFFIYKGNKYHHIIDPSTGYPTDNEISSISIISDRSIDGDALATALFILGVDKGSEIISDLEDVEAIFITKKGEVIIDEKAMKKFSLESDKLKLVKNSR